MIAVVIDLLVVIEAHPSDNIDDCCGASDRGGGGECDDG